ncbi:MAG: bifunctional phosphoribosylaminoimidazolecarboxamide formyltransferase/IMP cyclohydrolase [Thermoanaerobaculia bacterium]|nr:bifunctional phosphoribosylaminoimidazolecarboxamide formyltransferase/IMP cyclohydrolase [Thermoanaerobaculia bacterium]
MTRVRRALLSVSDKSHLIEFARGLAAHGIALLSTGGTLRHLGEAGLAVTAVSAVTGAPEILDGRVKTLHPKIHGGILADRSRPDHLAQITEHGIEPIDLVVVNLYPFAATVAKPGASREEIVENIDIGGPAMVRAAAKNHGSVAVVVDPTDYSDVLAALGAHEGSLPADLRCRLAAKAFRHTADYDAQIAAWMTPPEVLPERLDLRLERVLAPRYGENPHQASAVYRRTGAVGVLGGYRQLQGKELSWNNLLDADAARKIVAEFSTPAVVIVKHNNPCGVGVGPDLATAYARALATDPVSAFGSIVAVNRPLDGAAAAAMAELFIEVLTAPDFTTEAREHLASKVNLRLVAGPVYLSGGPTGAGELELRSIEGGFLAQEADSRPDDPATWTCPTRRAPSEAERAALELAWKVCRYTKSNAIVIANADQTVGIGAGQMSRVDSCRIAIDKAQLPVAGGVAASDAFFPFRDGLDVLAAAGVTAVVQPGGSKRDEEIFAAADEHGIAMVLTGTRHFRH